jgi:hypothetical protein
LYIYMYAYIHMSNCISRRDDLTIGRRWTMATPFFLFFLLFRLYKVFFLLCSLHRCEARVQCVYKINIAECIPKENDPNYDDFFFFSSSHVQHKRKMPFLFLSFVLFFSLDRIE